MNGSVIDGWQLVAESYTSGRRPRVAALRPGAAGFHAVSRHFRALHFATESFHVALRSLAFDRANRSAQHTQTRRHHHELT
jgi:hypothetical protein